MFFFELESMFEPLNQQSRVGGKGKIPTAQ